MSSPNEILDEIWKFLNCNVKKPEISIEKIGSWIWVSGNTFPIRERLKELGFFFSSNKKAWFWNGNQTKTRKAFYKSVDELKQKFGFIEVEF